MNNTQNSSDQYTSEKINLLFDDLEVKSKREIINEKKSIRKQGKIIEFEQSFSQERMWVFEQLNPNSIVNNLIQVYRLKGKLDLSRLEMSINHLLNNQQALKAAFKLNDGIPMQVIRSELFIPLQSIFIEDQVGDKERFINENILDIVNRPFNLEEGPLFDTYVIHMGKEEYIFVIKAHHLICDGWSFSLIMKEISENYISLSSSNGEALSYSPLSFEYSDYVFWQKNYANDPTMATHLDYWRKKLDGVTTFDLPSDHLRPTRPNFAGKRICFEITDKIIQKAKTFAQQQNATLHMFLFAAFNLLLYRYTNLTDIVIGVPIANRNKVEFEKTIGFFANSLVLRADLSENPTFIELIQRVRKTFIEAYEHQDLPYIKLIEALKPERNSSYYPFYEVLFSFVNTPPLLFDLPEIEVEELNFETGISQMDLTISLMEREGKVVAELQYSTDLYYDSTMERFIEHYLILISEILNNPNFKISELQILSKKEQELILEEWNGTLEDFPQDVCVHTLFEEQVNKNSDGIALVYKDECVTYKQLNERANQLAHYLQKQGVGPDKLIGIYLERSIEMIVGLLGIVKAGGAYVPINPSDPKERVRAIIEDAQLKILVSNRPLSSNLSDNSFQVICLDKLKREIDYESKEDLTVEISSENLIYVLFTSATTGNPKGVLIEHKGLVSLLCTQRKRFNFSAQDVWTQFHDYTFDYSVWEIWSSLTSGGKLVIIPSEIIHAPDEYWQMVLYEGVTILGLTPYGYRQFLPAIPNDIDLSIRLFVCGGEVFPIDLLWIFVKMGIPIINIYGPTEATIYTSVYAIPLNPETEVVVPIGKPIGNMKVYILDDDMQLMPVGTKGEIYIAGPGLARGYLNNSKLTNEYFKKNPFSQSYCSKVYKTGDIGKYLENGDIVFLGRKDNQIKIRGFRVELGEIEAVLKKHPEVREVVVKSIGDEVIAYIVVKKNFDPDNIKNFLKGIIPYYMIPSHIITLPRLPRTNSGKINRNALPEIKRKRADHGYVAPRNDIEKEIANIWQSVLQIDNVGIYDNFFDLGGNSLLAIQVVSKMVEANIQITSKDFFAEPRIADFKLVEFKREVANKKRKRTPILFDTSKNTILPFLEPKENLYVVWTVVESSIMIDDFKLEKCLDILVKYHESLRTRFVKNGKRWKQKIVSSEDHQLLQRLDISEVPEKIHNLVINKNVMRINENIDIYNGPIMQVLSIKKTHNKSIIIIMISHLVADGFAIEIFLNDLELLYLQLINNKRPNLPPTTTPMSILERELYNISRNKTKIVKKLQYWLNIPKEKIHPLFSVEDNKAPQRAGRKYKDLLIEFDLLEKAMAWKKIREFRFSIIEILLSSLVISYYHWKQHPNILIWMTNHGRNPQINGIELSRTIGNTANGYPVFFEIHDSDINLALLNSIKCQFCKAPNTGQFFTSAISFGENEISEKLIMLSKNCDLTFNYMHQMREYSDKQSIFKYYDMTLPLGLMISPTSPIRVNAFTNGSNLKLTFLYDFSIFPYESLKNLGTIYHDTLNEILSLFK